MTHPYQVQVDTTRNPSDGVAYQSYWEVLAYAFDDADPTIRIPASATKPVFVAEVKHIVDADFGALATINIGDGTDVDYWLATADIDQEVVGGVTSSLNATAPRNGREFTSPVAIKVTVGGTVSAGSGRVLAHILRL